MDSYRFKDLVDIPALQSLMDSFYKASAIPVGILSESGEILVATGWQDICTKYHRVCSETEALCKISDSFIKANLRVDEYIEYKCQNHMWDLATPIVIKDQHVATLFLGQFFYDDESVNVELFREQARKYGFTENEYLEALRKVPVFSRGKVKDIMDYYVKFVHSLIDTALVQAELKDYKSNLEELVSSRTKELESTTAALRESEERYRKAFHASTAVKLLIDPDTGMIFDANNAACEFYGYSLEELTSKYIYQINTLTHGEVEKEMAAARSEARGYFNFRHRLANGEIRDVEVYSSPITVAGKTALHSIIHDISNRKRVERALKESEKLFRAIFEQAPIGVALIDSATGALLRLNQKFCDIIGYSSEEASKLTFQQITHPDDLQADLDNMDRLKSGLIPMFSMEKRYYRKNRAIVWVNLTVVPLWEGGVLKEGGYHFAIVDDITERKKAETALLERDAELREAQRIAHVGSWKLDNATNHVVWTEELYNMLGLDPATPPPDYTEHSKLFTPESWERLSSSLARTQTEGIPYELELEMVRPGKENGWMLAIGEPLRDANGAITGLRGVAQDITERKRAAERLRAVSLYTRSLIEASLDPLVTISVDGRITDVNKATELVTGLSRERLIGSDFSDYFTEPDKAHAGYEQVFAQGYVTDYPLAIRHSFGKVTDVLYNASVYRDERGEVAGVFAAARDITERKRVEEQLRKDEEKLRAIYRVLPVGLSLVSEQRAVVQTNPSLMKILRMTKEGLQNGAYKVRKYFRSDGTLMREEDFPSYIAVTGKTEALDVEIGIELEDKSLIWTNVSSAPISGPEGGAVVVTTDITERRRAEEALRKAKEEAENATRLKDKFVSLVSHDLKGPLISMLGLLSMAVAEDQSLEERQKLDVIKAAISSGERMRSIIEDLLGVSRLRAGVVKMEMAFVNPYVIAGNAVSSLREMADKKGVTFTNNIPVISRIYADPALLEEVIRNILSNAIKFCHPGGRVNISLPPGEPSTIAVADDGIGIEPEKIGKLFSYDEKISTPGTSGEMGTGLGLPLCNDIVEAMRGKIRAESTIGNGSVFYVSLPYKRPVVMVVDDDPVQVMLMTTMLNPLQIDFATAYSGMDALKALEAKSPHLVIADIMMAGMDGFELMDSIRKKPGFDKTPVILVTSRGDIETRNMAFQKGASDFITKPLMADELIPRVRRFIW